MANTDSVNSWASRHENDRSMDNKPLHFLFEKQVQRTPDKIALVFEDQQLTYRELNEQANQLARCIRKRYTESQHHELSPDTLIAFCLERSTELIISILGILKAGAAYVAIDPNYPPDRVHYILHDTNSTLLLTQHHLVTRLNTSLSPNTQLLVLNEQAYQNEDTSNLAEYSLAHDLAYVIYTSGTTGLPKGVMQTHHNIRRLFNTTAPYFRFDSNDVWTLYHSCVFDFSVWELWGALIYGGMLVIPNERDTKDMYCFHQLCVQHQVSILNQTPSAFQAFTEQARLNQKSSLALRFIILGGEALRAVQLNCWWDIFGEAMPLIVNMYGITETTVHVTLKEQSRNELEHSVIGKPLSDLSVHILDETGDATPVGSIGELYVGGAGLARGYLNQPELTKERFIPNPFATEADVNNGYTRLYKTGDLVKQLANGDLAYIGRNDSQVKIRGHRIELGEIEHNLLMHPLIQQCVVVCRERVLSSTTQQYLVAYHVSRKRLSADVLRGFLSERIPQSMIPNTFVQMPKFPLTINGKIDRRALPEPMTRQEQPN